MKKNDDSAASSEIGHGSMHESSELKNHLQHIQTVRFFNKRGGLDLTIKAMFAIFIVLFVLFLGFSILGTRTETLRLDQQFSGQRSEQSFFLDLLGSPCLSVADSQNRSRYVETQSFVSQKKLDRLHQGNEDLRCAENFDYLYSVRITDEENGKEWVAGISPDDAYGTSRTITLPAVILYDPQSTDIPTTNIGRAFFKRYDGPLPRAYGAIKKACRIRLSDSISLNLPRDLSYDNESNKITYGSSFFYPYFGCGVGNFTIRHGNHLVFIGYKEGKVTIT